MEEINIPVDIDAENKKANECAIQHIMTFRDQSMRGEIADFGEPCVKCIHFGKCAFDWPSILFPLENNSDVKISLVYPARNPQPDKDVCETVKDTDTHHVDKKNP